MLKHDSDIRYSNLVSLTNNLLKTIAIVDWVRPILVNYALSIDNLPIKMDQFGNWLLSATV